MKNKVFTKKPNSEKRRYLSGVLKYAAGGALDDEMIERILPKVTINRQYTISVYSDNPAFKAALAHAKAGKVPLSIIHSRAGCSTIAAVITPRKTAAQNKRAIYIYSPNPYFWRGMSQWAKASKNG